MLLELVGSEEELATFQEKFPAAYRYAPFRQQDNTDHTVLVIEHQNSCREALTDTFLSNVSFKKR
jgi:hypothetical protein